MYAGRFAVSVVVSKKTARRAVDRHGIKRKVYAALSGLTRKPQGTCVFYPNQATLRVSSREITKELEMHFK
jgi:ribonuclease P protein component